MRKCNANHTLHDSLKFSNSPKSETNVDFDLEVQKAEESIESLENLQNLKFDGFKTALEICKSAQVKIEENSQPHSTIETYSPSLENDTMKTFNENFIPDLSTIESLNDIKLDGFKSALQIIKTQEAEREMKLKSEEKKNEKPEDRKKEKTEENKRKEIKKRFGEGKESGFSKKLAKNSLFDCEPRETAKKKFDSFKTALEIAKSEKVEESGEKSNEAKNSAKRKSKREKVEGLSKTSKSSKDYKKDVGIAMHWKISEITKKNLQEHFPSPDIPDSDTFKQICRKMVHQLLAKKMSGEPIFYNYKS